jgi:hypothetical protein
VHQWCSGAAACNRHTGDAVVELNNNDTIDLLAVARNYRELGYSVIPLGPTKLPAFQHLPRIDGSPSWNPYRNRLADDGQLHAWFGAHGDSHLGTACGAATATPLFGVSENTWIELLSIPV